jgi:hypothetical protein
MHDADERFRRAIVTKGPVFPSPEGGPDNGPTDVPLSIWRRTNTAQAWFEIEGAANWAEVVTRLPHLLLRRWHNNTVPVEWLVTTAVETPETAKQSILYVRLAWPSCDDARRGATTK